MWLAEVHQLIIGCFPGKLAAHKVVNVDTEDYLAVGETVGARGVLALIFLGAKGPGSQFEQAIPFDGID
jgi:hypothetical protein